MSNIFENVTYEGDNAGNPFTVYADRAEIKENANIIHMKKMIIKIFLRDSKWVIECAIGIYNKSNYNIFCSQDVKATDGKIIIYSQNLDLLNEGELDAFNGWYGIMRKGSAKYHQAALSHEEATHLAWEFLMDSLKKQHKEGRGRYA